MISFYGGPAGQSFEIKEVFSTYGDLRNDINKGWKSEIAVGEFVMVSYGAPSDDAYEERRDKDLNAGYGNQNSTLWQKIYNEGASTTGIDYRFITSCTGNTPRIDFVDEEGVSGGIEVIPAGDEPYIKFDPSDVDKPKVTLYLPNAWQFANPEMAALLNYGAAPAVTMVEEIGADGNGTGYLKLTFAIPRNSRDIRIDPAVVPLHPEKEPTVTEAITENGNVNTLTFSLPKAWQFSHLTTPLKADEPPKVNMEELDNSGEYQLEFRLPKSQVIVEGEHEWLDPGVDPEVIFDKTDINNPVLTFKLPKTQSLQDGSVKFSDPASNEASAEVGYETLEDGSNDYTKPKYEFTLPRAAKYFYGEELDGQGEDKEVTTLPSADMGIGDFYININTGCIYEYSSETGTDHAFTFVGCFQPDAPEVTSEPINPYDANGVPVEPKAERTLTENNEWSIDFDLPKAPAIEAEYEDIAPEAESGLATDYSETGVKFTFSIPRGAKIYTGDAASMSTLTGMGLGDIFINTDADDSNCGRVYKYTSTGWTWDNERGIRGEQGPVLNITNYLEAKIGQTGGPADDTLDIVSAWVETELGRIPGVDELISVVHEDEEGSKIAYWYFQAYLVGETDPSWQRVQLTGSQSSFLQNVYLAGAEENKAYTVGYINSLIAASPVNKDLNTYNATAIDKTIEAVNKTITETKSALEKTITEQLVDVLTTENADKVAYTAKYINALLKDAKYSENDANNFGYTARYLNELLDALTKRIEELEAVSTWGSFSELLADATS